MASAGWQVLGNAIGGGNKLPSELAYEQGQSLGANTADALAQARARIDTNTAKENADQALQGSIPDPKLRALVVNSIQGGYDPRNVTGSQLDAFKLSQQQAVADPNTSDDQAGRSLAAIGQPGIIKAVGDNGNLVNELHPTQGVQISPLGAAIGGATAAKSNADAQLALSAIPKNAAETAKANAEAQLASTNASNGGAHLPPGYAPLLDANGQQVIDPATGLPKLAQRAGGPADVNTARPMGAVEARSVNRSLDAANQSVQDLGQIASLPVGASTGILGYGGTPGKSILDSLSTDLKNRLAPNEVQQYNVVSSGMSRALASLEAAGQIPSGSFTSSFDKLQILDGDDAGMAALKLAKQKQIMKSAIESTIIDNPRVPAAFQTKAQGYIDQMDTAIPFEPQDVIKLQNKGGNQTLGQSLGLKPKAPPAPTTIGAPAAAPAAAAPTAPAAKSPANTIQMKDASGKLYAIPASQVPDAKADGLQEL